MLSEDVYRSRLQTTIASLKYWVPTIIDVANVNETETDEFWKLNVSPKVAGACPFEILLRSDQHYDMLVAGEAYESLPMESFDLFLKLAQAICDGNVVQRLSHSTATGKPTGIATIVRLPGGEEWQHGRRFNEDAADDGDAENQFADHEDEVHMNRFFLPYRR